MAAGKYFRRAVAAVVLMCTVAWGADWLVLRRKVARDGGFDQVEVRYRYEVHMKNRQIEQRTQKPEMEECVESVFPHYEETPCWYLKKHSDQIQDLDGGQWHFWSDDRP